MTVCIAAIYNDNAIFGASDRMVTGGYGDITFEPPIEKILQLTNSIAVLTAGDQSIQTQVYYKAFKIIREIITADPSKWVDISNAAEIYSKCFYEVRNKLIEDNILSSYNLTFDSFYEKQKLMDKDFIYMVNSKIDRFIKNLNGIATIITGIDDSGPHIYVVDDGEVGCHDKLGFAAIGIGAYHATSHFMLSGYTHSLPEEKALLTIHQAKKKAEVSPGVGKETDMCVIGPLKGSFVLITHPSFPIKIIKDLDNYYKSYKKSIKKIDNRNEEKIRKYLAEMETRAQQKQAVSPSPSVSPSASVSSSASPSPSVSPSAEAPGEDKWE